MVYSKVIRIVGAIYGMSEGDSKSKQCTKTDLVTLPLIHRLPEYTLGGIQLILGYRRMYRAWKAEQPFIVNAPSNMLPNSTSRGTCPTRP